MKSVIVIGDLNLDVILSGISKYPSLGEEIFAEDRLVKAGGSAANVAFVLASNNWPVKLFSSIGKDSQGQFILKYLEEQGLDTATISRCDDPTGITISLSYPNDRMYVSYPGTVATTTLDMLPDGYLSKGDHLHLAAYFLQKALKPAVGPLLKKAKKAGMSTSLDPGSDPMGQWDISELEPYLQYIDWFMPNLDEILAVTKTNDLEQSIKKFPAQSPGIIVKAGPQGAITRFNGKVEHYPAQTLSAIDTTCAGDCFNAAFLLARCQDKPLEEAVRIGNRFGALSVCCVGFPDEKIKM